MWIKLLDNYGNRKKGDVFFIWDHFGEALIAQKMAIKTENPNLKKEKKKDEQSKQS